MATPAAAGAHLSAPARALHHSSFGRPAPRWVRASDAAGRRSAACPTDSTTPSRCAPWRSGRLHRGLQCSQMGCPAPSRAAAAAPVAGEARCPRRASCCAAGGACCPFPFPGAESALMDWALRRHGLPWGRSVSAGQALVMGRDTHAPPAPSRPRDPTGPRSAARNTRPPGPAPCGRSHPPPWWTPQPPRRNGSPEKVWAAGRPLVPLLVYNGRFEGASTLSLMRSVRQDRGVPSLDLDGVRDGGAPDQRLAGQQGTKQRQPAADFATFDRGTSFPVREQELERTKEACEASRRIRGMLLKTAQVRPPQPLQRLPAALPTHLCAVPPNKRARLTHRRVWPGPRDCNAGWRRPRPEGEDRSPGRPRHQGRGHNASAPGAAVGARLRASSRGATTAGPRPTGHAAVGGGGRCGHHLAPARRCGAPARAGGE